MENKVEKILNPKTIAVIGASNHKEKVGHIIFKNLVANKKLKIFPVNPKTKKILGKICYKNIKDIKQNIDLSIIVVKAKIVPMILQDIVEAHLKNVIIISSGFSEVGNKKLQEKIINITKKNKINLLGPNVLGIINPIKQINASFFKYMPKKGHIALISQSGALGVGILDMGLPLSGFISLGNMDDLDFSDFIKYYCKDKNTKTIILYIESFKPETGKKFIEVCKKCKKIIIALKAGRTEQGGKAAALHTASLASDARIYSGVFKQLGIKEVHSINEMINTALGKKQQRKPINILEKRKIGNRACIITNAGGLGVLATDYCKENNIKVPELPENIKQKLNKVLPEAWSHNNPIDIMGDALPERYNKTISLLEKEKFFDFFLILLTPQEMTQPLSTAKILVSRKKPIFTGFVGGRSVEAANKFLKEKGIINSVEIRDLIEGVGEIILR